VVARESQVSYNIYETSLWPVLRKIRVFICSVGDIGVLANCPRVETANFAEGTKITGGLLSQNHVREHQIQDLSCNLLS
jgi:hypothetical protein